MRILFGLAVLVSIGCSGGDKGETGTDDELEWNGTTTDAGDDAGADDAGADDAGADDAGADDAGADDAGADDAGTGDGASTGEGAGTGDDAGADDGTGDDAGDGGAGTGGSPSVGDDCGAITFIGCCTSDEVLVYCLDDSINRINCAEDGHFCSWFDASAGYTCAPSSAGLGTSDPSGAHPRECPFD